MNHWKKELKELGWERMLLSRLEFQGAISTKDVMEMTGKGRSTVTKHMSRLVETGKAVWRSRGCLQNEAIKQPNNPH